MPALEALARIRVRGNGIQNVEVAPVE